MPLSGGEDSQSPAQGHFLSGAEPSPPAPRPFSDQPRPPPTLQPLSAAPPGGFRERLKSRESCQTRTFGPCKRRPRASWVPGTEMTAWPAGLRAVGPGPRFPGSCCPLRQHLCRLLPAALPLHLHPAQPAHAPRPHRFGLGSSLGSASQEPIRADERGGALGGSEGVDTPPTCPWKRMNGAWQKGVKGVEESKEKQQRTFTELLLCASHCANFFTGVMVIQFSSHLYELNTYHPYVNWGLWIPQRPPTYSFLLLKIKWPSPAV